MSSLLFVVDCDINLEALEIIDDEKDKGRCKDIVKIGSCVSIKGFSQGSELVGHSA